MKTATDTPHHELQDAPRTRAKTRRGAVVAVIVDFNRRMADLVQYAGTCPDLMTVQELQAQRRRRLTSVDP